MTCLIFDLDNTLYPHSPQVEADFANRIKNYFLDHLSANFENEGFSWEKASVNIGAYLDEIFKGKEKQRMEFLNYICDVDVSSFAPNPELNRLLKHLPHDKYIFTDSTLRHVHDTLNQIGIDLENFKGFLKMSTAVSALRPTCSVTAAFSLNISLNLKTVFCLRIMPIIFARQPGWE